MDNLEGMDKFLERYSLQRLNLEEIEYLNRQITSIETETVIKNIQKTNDVLTGFGGCVIIKLKNHLVKGE